MTIVDKLKFESDYFTSLGKEYSIMNSNEDKGFYRGFHYYYGLNDFARNSNNFYIRLEKNHKAIYIPFNKSDNFNDCITITKEIIDFICDEVEDALIRFASCFEKNKIMANEELNDNEVKKEIDTEEIEHKNDQIEENKSDINKNSSTTLNDWFKSTDITRYLK